MGNEPESTGKAGEVLSILHIFSDGPSPTAMELIKHQSELHDVSMVDLTKCETDYGDIIDRIFSCDKLVSW